MAKSFRYYKYESPFFENAISLCQDEFNIDEFIFAHSTGFEFEVKEKYTQNRVNNNMSRKLSFSKEASCAINFFVTDQRILILRHKVDSFPTTSNPSIEKTYSFYLGTSSDCASIVTSVFLDSKFWRSDRFILGVKKKPGHMSEHVGYQLKSTWIGPAIGQIITGY